MEQKNNLTEVDWLYAYDHLNMLIAEYTSIGTAGVATLYMILLPLKRKYDAGIRTKELYDDIVNRE